MQILRQGLDNHLHDFIQQHLLLLLNDSVENKKKNDDLSIKNQLLNNQLKNDSVENKKRFDELFTENQRLNQQLKNDSVENKKRFDELFTGNQMLNQQLKDDSVEHKKRIDEFFFTENKRLNQQLKETKADSNLFKENAEKTCDEQMISKLLDQCVTDVCDDFNKTLMERYNGYLRKSNQTASANIRNSLLRKFCSFEEILIEAEVQKCIDQFSKELQDNFIQDKMLHAYKQKKIDSIDDLNKIKTILPSSCWKGANEKMKRCVEFYCNFQYMKQGIKFDNDIERKDAASKPRLLEQYRSVLQQENKRLYLDGYHYYQITLASLPLTRSITIGSYGSNLQITVSIKNNVISFSFKRNGYSYASLTSHPVLVDAGGQQLNLKCVVQFQEYICEQSINELKDMGYIVNDGFVLRLK